MSAGTADATYNDVAVPWWLPVLALGVVTAGVSYVTGILATRALGRAWRRSWRCSRSSSAWSSPGCCSGSCPGEVQLLGGVLLLAGG